MSYWGSHYSALPVEKEEDKIAEDDPAKQLCDNLNITKEEFDELKECFKICDKSGKGKVSAMELKSLMKSVGDDADDEDIREILYETDRDGDGEIDFVDFLHFMHKGIKQPITDEDVGKCFNVFDNDGNGYVTIRGLERVFLSFGQQHTSSELKDLISFIDTDTKEGLVTHEHFKDYLVKQNLLRRKEEMGDGNLPKSSARRKGRK